MDEDDKSLWQRFIKDIKPIVKRRADKPAPETLPIAKAKPAASKRAQPRERIIFEPGIKALDIPPPAQSPQLDRRTDTKLRRGQMMIEGALDLHGMTQAQALSALTSFVNASQASGKRCVLVITGKGKSTTASDEWPHEKPGILKQKLPEWLALAPLNRLVLKYTQAQPKHGGSGAFYVYLKRDR